MRGQKTRTFGVLIPDFSINYYSELLNYIEMEARTLGYLAIMCTTETDAAREKEYFDDLIRRQVDGFILCWYRGGNEKLQYLREILKKVPIIVMDQPIEGLEASSVYIDGYKGIRNLTTAFIKQNRRDIAMIMDSKHYSANERRFQGYLDGLSSHKIEVNDRLIVQSDLSIEAGYNTARKLFNRATPSAIVAIDDLTAIGALQYCNDQNIQVPDQVSITGFDDIPLAKFVSPRLTTIAQPMKEMAACATKQLINEINSRSCEHKEYVFEPEIVLRESTNLSKKDIHSIF